MLARVIDLVTPNALSGSLHKLLFLDGVLKCCQSNVLCAVGCSVEEMCLATERRRLPRRVWLEQSCTSSMKSLLLIWGL